MKRSLKNLLWAAACVVVLSSTPSGTGLRAQARFEAGIAVGPSNFLGDLGGNFGRGTPFFKDNNVELTRLMKGAFVSFSPKPFINIRASLNMGKLEGADSIIKPRGGHEMTRIERNLHFRSPVYEALLTAEFYPTVFLEDDQDDVYRKLRPYFVIGVGGFRFNPQGQYVDQNGNKTWVDLRPLRTEGQGMPSHPERKEYSLTQINIPYGVGFKYFVSDRINIGFELVIRSTFTDYIDDVSTKYIPDQDFYDFFGPNTFQADMAVKMANMSNLTVQSNTRTSFTGTEQRGEPLNDDSYYASSFKMGIRLGRGESRYMRGAQERLRCPIVRF